MSYAFQFCSAPVAELDNIHFKKLVRKLTPAHPSLFYRYFNYPSENESAAVAREQTTGLQQIYREWQW